jgi:hypothetical protein
MTRVSMTVAAVAPPRFTAPDPTLTSALIDVGHDFWRRGWSLGTSSNYSVVVHRDPPYPAHDRQRL